MPTNRVVCSVILSVFCVFSSARGTADDQGVKEPRDAISLNLIRTIEASIPNFNSSGTIAVPLAFEYQHSSGNHFTRLVAVTFIYSYNAGSTTITFDQIYEADWHPFNQGMDGWFFGVFLDTGYVDLDDRNGNLTSNIVIGVGPAVGYELTFPNRLFLEFSGCVGVGIGYNTGASGAVIVPAFPYRIDAALGYRL